VGDYCRALAEELERSGVETRILSLEDRDVVEPQQDNESLRIPQRLDWDRKRELALDFLRDFRPDWTSLQFVPYGFDSKGIVRGLGQKLKFFSENSNLHFMFHEIWIAVEEKSALRRRLVGAIQRHFIKRMLAKLKPRVIHTSNQGYALQLSRHGIQAAVLPLFGNIGISPLGPTWMEREAAKNGLLGGDRENHLIFGIFGNLPSELRLEPFLLRLLQLEPDPNKRILVWGIGNLGESGEKQIAALQAGPPGRTRVHSLGRRTPDEISSFLQYIDWGVATTPSIVIGKSGATACMLEHGLPVMVPRDTQNFRKGKLSMIREDSQLFFLNHDLREDFHRMKKRPAISFRNRTCQELLASFEV